jgi:putative endonuclease
MQYYVYILTNKNHTVLYTGVTRDLIRRVYEHKNNSDPNSFTAKYKVHKLVYFEETNDVKAAIEREKQIKSWSRSRKTDLIFNVNPHWIDLYNRILG